QFAADAAPDLGRVDVDRVLEREAVGGSRPKQTGIAISDDPSGAFADEIRQTARQDLVAPASDLVHRWRHLLEGGDPIAHMMTVDRGDRGDIRIARRPDYHLIAGHPASVSGSDHPYRLAVEK